MKVDLKLVKLKSDDPIAWYNLACSLSLLKRSTESLSAIGKSLRLGYRDIKYLLSDPDLENLRKSEKFKEIVFRLTGQQN